MTTAQILKRIPGESDSAYFNRIDEEYQKHLGRKERLQKDSQLGMDRSDLTKVLRNELSPGGAITDAARPAAEEGRTREKAVRDRSPKSPADPGAEEYVLLAERDGLISQIDLALPGTDLEAMRARVRDLSNLISMRGIQKNRRQGWPGASRGKNI